MNSLGWAPVNIVYPYKKGNLDTEMRGECPVNMKTATRKPKTEDWNSPSLLEETDPADTLIWDI